MEKENKEMEEYVSKIVNPIFSKSLGEKIDNTMSVVKNIKVFWRPNNYRLLIPFNRKSFKITLHREATFPVDIKVSNYNSKVTAKNYNGITLMLDKKSITAIYSLKTFGRKLWYMIESDSIKGIEERIDEKVKEIENKCIKAVKDFVKVFGGRAYYYERKWIRHEDGVHGEDFIDKIPRDMIIHDTYFKKVYEDHIEFKSPAFVKNYISNRAIEQIAPIIADNQAKLMRKQTSLSIAMKDTFNKFISLNQANLTQTTKIVGFMKTFGIAMEQHVALISEIRGVVKPMNQSIEGTRQLTEETRKLVEEMRELRKPFFKRLFGKK